MSCCSASCVRMGSSSSEIMKLPSKILRQIPDLPFLAFHQIIGILSKLLPTLRRQTSHRNAVGQSLCLRQPVMCAHTQLVSGIKWQCPRQLALTWPVFQSNLDKLVPEWRTIQNFNGATDDGGGTNWNSYYAQSTSQVTITIIPTQAITGWMLFLSPN